MGASLEKSPSQNAGVTALGEPEVVESAQPEVFFSFERLDVMRPSEDAEIGEVVALDQHLVVQPNKNEDVRLLFDAKLKVVDTFEGEWQPLCVGSRIFILRHKDAAIWDLQAAQECTLTGWFFDPKTILACATSEGVLVLSLINQVLTRLPVHVPELTSTEHRFLLCNANSICSVSPSSALCVVGSATRAIVFDTARMEPVRELLPDVLPMVAINDAAHWQFARRFPNVGLAQVGSDLVGLNLAAPNGTTAFLFENAAFVALSRDAIVTRESSGLQVWDLAAKEGVPTRLTFLAGGETATVAFLSDTKLLLLYEDWADIWDFVKNEHEEVHESKAHVDRLVPFRNGVVQVSKTHAEFVKVSE